MSKQPNIPHAVHNRLQRVQSRFTHIATIAATASCPIAVTTKGVRSPMVPPPPNRHLSPRNSRPRTTTGVTSAAPTTGRPALLPNRTISSRGVTGHPEASLREDICFVPSLRSLPG